VELAARLAARSEPVELPLTPDEFTAYVLSLRNYMQRASAGDMADWNRRMRAIDLLHEVRKELGTDSIDTAQLRACNESRASVLNDQSPYLLRLAGELGGIAVLALDEYRWVGVLRSQRFVVSLVDRIAEAAR
jgi:hypothetical protein